MKNQLGGVMNQEALSAIGQSIRRLEAAVADVYKVLDERRPTGAMWWLMSAPLLRRLRDVERYVKLTRLVIEQLEHDGDPYFTGISDPAARLEEQRRRKREGDY